MLKSLAYLPRRKKQLLMIACDVVLLPLAFWIALALRFSTFTPPINNILWIFFIIPIMAVPLFVPLGLYRTVIRYADERMLLSVIYGVSLAVLGLALIIFMGNIVGIPRSSLAIFWLLAISGIMLVRWLARKIILGVERRQLVQKRQRIAIYGAGRAGIQLAMALSSSPEYQVRAFFDDDEDLHGATVAGIRVFSPTNAQKIISSYDLQGLILAVPSASRGRKKEIIQYFEKFGLDLKTLPGMAELVGGQVRIEDLREVGIEDLLGRDPVPPNEDLLAKCIQGKVVLVTGAGGSIGSELCRQILKGNPLKLVLYEVSEYSLYKIEKELLSFGSQVKIVAVLGDARDGDRIKSAMKNHRVQTVYHAAAYKHVPLVEWNVVAGVDNNLFGTLNTAVAAMEAGVEIFVLISTDKAVRPTNVMGASKRMAELVLQGFSREEASKATRFCMVRFGNVLGSSGSVVPLFREQIRRGGPVTLTHSEVTRFFMTIPEAAQLVIQAGAMASGGEVFVLDMGDSIKIKDLAYKMIHLSGLSVKDVENPNGDIEVQVTGLRPGEKLYEELLIGNNVTTTIHPRIRKADEKYFPWPDLSKGLTQINQACRDQDEQKTRDLLKTWVTEYNPSGAES